MLFIICMLLPHKHNGVRCIRGQAKIRRAAYCARASQCRWGWIWRVLIVSASVHGGMGIAGKPNGGSWLGRS